MAQILVVDDDGDVADTMAAVLELGGHTVRTAHDGLEGLARVAERRPDVVVLDVEMPLLDGPGMAYALFLANVDLDRIPIVLVSGAVLLRDIAARVGTPYRLAKPYSIDALEGLVDRALRELTAPHPDHAAFRGAAANRVK